MIGMFAWYKGCECEILSEPILYMDNIVVAVRMLSSDSFGIIDCDFIKTITKERRV